MNLPDYEYAFPGGYDIPADVQPDGDTDIRTAFATELERQGLWPDESRSTARKDSRGDYRGIAAALVHIADQIATVPDPDRQLWASLQLQLPPAQTERVDDYAWAVLGNVGETRQLSSGPWHHDASGRIGDGVTGDWVHVSVFCSAAEPVEVKRERLAAELAALDAQIGGERA